jgi:predicted outer membrane repeat protein
MNLTRHAVYGRKWLSRAAASVAGATILCLGGAQAASAAKPPESVPCKAAALQNAVNNNDGAPLDLAFNCVYRITSGMQAPNDLTINGDHATIQPALGSPAMSMLTNENSLTISDLTMRYGNGGASGDGAAIDNDGLLTVSHSTFTSNHASQDGGAIYSDTTATISDSTFIGNTSADAGGAIAQSTAQLNLTNCTFQRNAVQAGGQGGAVSLSAAKATLDDLVFNTNLAPQGDGGAIYSGAIAEVTQASFQGNTAADGGAVYVDAPGPDFNSLQVSQSAAIGNSAVSGGAFYVADGADLGLTSVEVLANAASDDGGGVYNSPGGTVNLSSSILIGNSPDNCAPPGSVPGCFL